MEVLGQNLGWPDLGLQNSLWQLFLALPLRTRKLVRLSAAPPSRAMPSPGCLHDVCGQAAGGIPVPEHAGGLWSVVTQRVCAQAYVWDGV